MARLWKTRHAIAKEKEAEKKRAEDEANRLRNDIRTTLGEVIRLQLVDVEKRLAQKIQDAPLRTDPGRIEVPMGSSLPRTQPQVLEETPAERLKKILGEYKKRGDRDAGALRDACEAAGARWGTAFVDGSDAQSRLPVTWGKGNGPFLALQLDLGQDEVILLPNGRGDRGILTAVTFSAEDRTGPVGAVEEARGLLESNSAGETVIRITKKGHVL